MVFRSRGGRGFTLVELIIVIAIMGIMASIAMPRYGNSIARYRIESAAQRIAADLTMARSLADARSQSVGVSFNVASDQYTIASVSGLDDPSSAYQVNLGASPYQVDLDSVWFAGSATASFDGFGLPEQGGTVVVKAGTNYRTIVLEDDSGGTRIVVTDQATADSIRSGDSGAISGMGVDP